MERQKADITAVVREEGEIHILKAKIIDESSFYFQMYNKTKKVLSPCFELKGSYGIGQTLNPSKEDKRMYDALSHTKNINRRRLVFYFNLFKLQFLVNAYHNFK